MKENARRLSSPFASAPLGRKRLLFYGHKTLVSIVLATPPCSKKNELHVLKYRNIKYRRYKISGPERVYYYSRRLDKRAGGAGAI